MVKTAPVTVAGEPGLSEMLIGPAVVLPPVAPAVLAHGRVCAAVGADEAGGVEIQRARLGRRRRSPPPPSALGTSTRIKIRGGRRLCLRDEEPAHGALKPAGPGLPHARAILE